MLETALVALGGSAMLVAAVAWLARSIIDQFLSKDLERFKSELASASSLSAERTRHELALAAQEKGLLLTKLHEKRAQVIAELYGLLVEAQWASQDFASPIEWSGQPSKREKYATALNKSTDFYRFFEKNRIYLPVELCDSLDGFLKSMRAKVVGFGVYLASDEEHLPDGASRKKLEAWADASQFFDQEAPSARQALEAELRHLIGVVERRDATS